MAAATARIVGATARSMGEMSMPARLNMPPFAPKSFCMSITSTAHLPEVDTNRFRFCLYGDYTALVAHGRPFLTRPPTDSGAVFSPDVPHCAWGTKRMIRSAASARSVPALAKINAPASCRSSSRCRATGSLTSDCLGCRPRWWIPFHVLS